MKEKKSKKAKVKEGVSKKDIRNKIQDSVNHAIADLHVESPSKKTKKAVKKVSSKLAGKIKKELKKKAKAQKKSKLPVDGGKLKAEA